MPQSSNKVFVYIGIITVVVLIGMIGYLLYPRLQAQRRLFSSKEAEEILLKQLPNDAPKADQDRRFNAILSLAKTADRINISGCRPNPLVYKTTQTELKFVNPDSTAHYIAFDKNRSYVIQGNSTVTLQPVLQEADIMAYGYGCDGSENSVGYILLEKK